MKHYSILLLFALLLRPALAQESDVEALFDKFKAAARFDYTFPREKVYLHLDNAAYFEGDTLWYKAYVVRASSLRPTALSRVLYVELLGADGQQMALHTLRLDSLGTASGGFPLLLPIRAGYHEVRAYTREMVNWGEEACFSRVVPVFHADANPLRAGERGAETDATQLFLPQPEPYKRTSLGQPRPWVMGENAQRRLDFFPEGGGRAAGVAGRVAFKLTDGRGLPVADTVKVFDAEGRLCTMALPEHEGMGEVVLPASFSEGYATLAPAAEPGHGPQAKAPAQRYPLPPPTAACGLWAEPTDSGLYVRIEAARALRGAGELLGLAVMNRENMCYFDTLTLGAEPIELLVPAEALRGGVNRVEVFDSEGRSRASRLCWSMPAEAERGRSLQLEVMQNERSYAPFAPIAVKVRATDAEGRPAAGVSLSMAVRDGAAGLVQTPDGGLGAHLLLASEVRGYIHRPDLYFERNDAAHRRMLDLLLRVQGWRANRFEVMCGREAFDLRQPIEQKLVVRGRVFHDNDRQEPFAGLTLDMRAYRFENDSVRAEAIEGTARTDAEGRFAFESNVDFEGEYLAQFTLRAGEKQKKKWGRLAIDRWFAPPLRPLLGPELELSFQTSPADEATPPDRDPRRREAATFCWTDTLPEAVQWVEGEAEVVARKKYKGLRGSRHTWLGGPGAGMRRATKVYPIRREWERYKDGGHETVMPLMDFLSYLHAPLETDAAGTLERTSPFEAPLAYGEEAKGKPADPYAAPTAEAAEEQASVRFRGRPTRLYVDNEAKAELEPLLCDEVKYVMVVDDNYATDQITGKSRPVSRARYSIYIYKDPSAWRTRGGKGREYRHLSGFTPQPKFYSPNYRGLDLPSAADLRRTLHWSPRLVTDAAGEAHVTLFGNARPGLRLDVSVRGIDAQGRVAEWN